MRERFWERLTLEELTDEEWEALCDGCGRCCLVKIEEEDTGDIATLNVACKLLDIDSCRCSDYPSRFSQVPECTKLSLDNVELFRWLPETCGYRRMAEGRGLARWHPLRSGDPERVHRKGISVRSFAVSERDVDEEDYEDHIIAVLPIEY
ncbi:YcgN family cysteine cluster protein [Phytohalomonas tamaricis]|uniref:YcgN family cysteine cluster protein n=1 Tax=Phytohalomonas tamaricis TaxID=2081032 RepID=UPI0021D45F55|nr:YcgN family cysteine cluster protein [Phytohalomonas tamaricis]